MNIEAALTRARAGGGQAAHRAARATTRWRWTCGSGCGSKSWGCCSEMRLLQRALVRLGEREREVLIPGYTHLQRAQPVYLAHHLLAYVEMLARDCAAAAGMPGAGQRLPAGQRRAGRLDAAARPRAGGRAARVRGCARTAAPDAELDGRRERPGFRGGVLRTAALLAVHLSRLAEDLVLWSSAEFNFIRIADAYTTGSSLMPQKKNPDVAELIRGKSARVIGNLVALLTLLKGLPMTYNRDLQEDKERLFDTGGYGASVRCGSARRCSSTPRSTGRRAGRPPATRRCWRPTWRITWSARACPSGRRITRSARWWRWPNGWASP